MFPCAGCTGNRSALCGDCEAADRELEDLRYDLEQAERRLAIMESGGPHRITNEPEWNRAVRRQRDKVRDLRGELAELEGDDG